MSPARRERLFIRVETPFGPRTLISQELCEREARSIAEVLSATGLELARRGDCVAVTSVRNVLARRRVGGNLRALKGGQNS